MESKFQFYEIVRISPKAKAFARLGSVEGAVLGKAQNDEGQWSYAVHIYHLGRVWSLDESDLLLTGKMDRRETFYDGTSIRVIVDPDTGEGRIKE